MAKRSQYHHGALREALLATALSILEQNGLEALSLRELATRSGVSHAAPAHHFSNRKALLTALAVIAFERFELAMREARAAASKAPPEQMRAAGRGYVQFARCNPNLFRLMFSAALLDWDNAALEASAHAAFQQLTEITAPAAVALGMTSKAARVELEKLVWSTVHGYSHLANEGQMAWLGAEAAAPDREPDIARFLFAPARAIPRKR